jgi:hypothetical protein
MSATLEEGRTSEALSKGGNNDAHTTGRSSKEVCYFTVQCTLLTAKRRPSSDHPIFDSDSRPLPLLEPEVAAEPSLTPPAASLLEERLLRTGKRGTAGSEVERERSQRVTWPAAEAEAKRAGCFGDHATSATYCGRKEKEGRKEGSK